MGVVVGEEECESVNAGVLPLPCPGENRMAIIVAQAHSLCLRSYG